MRRNGPPRPENSPLRTWALSLAFFIDPMPYRAHRQLSTAGRTVSPFWGHKGEKLDVRVPYLFSSCHPGSRPMATDDDPPFKVEQRDRDGNRIERVIGRAENLIVGRVLFS